MKQDYNSCDARILLLDPWEDAKGTTTTSIGEEKKVIILFFSLSLSLSLISWKKNWFFCYRNDHINTNIYEKNDQEIIVKVSFFFDR